MMKIAVLITCHNRRDTTIRCLRSLLPQLTVDDSLFIVDDGSTDGTESAIKGLLYAASSMVKIISGDGSLFWAKGMNLAWNMAVTADCRYDFYLWLNDDVVLQNDAITGLTNDWKLTGDSFSVIVGACASDETLKHSSYGATNGSDERIIPNGVGPRSASGWFNGNVVLVPHRTFLSIGMISPDYSHGRADYDYAERLRSLDICQMGACMIGSKCCFDQEDTT